MKPLVEAVVVGNQNYSSVQDFVHQYQLGESFFCFFVLGGGGGRWHTSQELVAARTPLQKAFNFLGV